MARKNEALITFRAETKEFTDGIKKVNKSLSDLKSDLKLANAEVKANGESFENLSKKAKVLKDAMETNGEKIQLLEKKLETCKKTLGENSDEYSKLYKQLNNAKTMQVGFQGELSQTEKKLKSLGDELDASTKDLKEFDDATDDTTDGTNGLQGILGKLKGGFGEGLSGAVALGTALGGLLKEAIMACINAIKNFCTYLWDLPEATAEFRTNLAKLEGSTKQYGYSTKDTNKQMKELYGYFADEQVCVNTITNLQGMKLSQSDLSKTTNACIAVWTAYGDSIPIESLTESVNETAQVGKVTGSLADALNWAGISEDNFNKKLESCKTTQERAKLITDTLNKAYGQSKKTFDDNTQSVQKLRQAEYDLQSKEAELAKSIDPLKTKFIELKSQGLQAVIDVMPKITKGFQDLRTWMGEVAKKCKEVYDNSKTLQTIFELLKIAAIVVGEKLQTLWSVLKLVWEVAKLLWEACKPIAQIFYTIAESISGALLPKLQNLDTKTSSTRSTLDKLTSTVKTVREWLGNLANYKWDIKNPTMPKVDVIIKNLIDSIKRFLSNHGISWKIPQPSLPSVNVWNLINTIKNNLKNHGISWKIPSPSLPSVNVWNLINTIKNNLRYHGISWSIPKPSLPSVSVSSLISSIKNNLRNHGISWSIPKPKLPSFRASIRWTTTTVLGKSFRYPSGISWNKKGGIFTSPTIFATPNAGLQGVGEAGAEAIIPLDSFYNHLDSKIEETNNNAMLSRIYSLLATMELKLEIDGKEFTRTAIAPNSKEIDNYNNMRTI